MLSGSWTDRRVGDFEIKERIGRGASAAVYRAQQVSVNRSVALKIIDLAGEETVLTLERFEQEAHVIASLEHLHIVPIYDYGVLEDQYAYFAARLMTRSLEEELRAGVLSLNRAARIISQIAGALKHAHQHGVIHRDIKPSNILLDDLDNAYLSDFGLAFRLNPEQSNADAAFGLIGTPSYIAPEILDGKPADERSDVYSFGVVMYHMLTGRVPFESTSGMNIASIFYKHAQQAPQPPTELNPALPADIEAVILRALAKAPDSRYPSIDALASAFFNALEAYNAPLHGAVTLLRRPTPRIRTIKRMHFIAGAISAVLLAAIGVWAIRMPDAVVVTTTVESARGAISLSADELAAAQTALGTEGFVAYFVCDADEQAAEAAAVGTIANELNVPLRIYNSNNDAYLQVTQVENARTEGANAVILCPVAADMAGSIADSLAAAAIPLILTSPIDHSYGIRLDFNNYEVGLQIGRYAGRLLQTDLNGAGRVVLLGAAGLPASDNRVRGMRAGLAQVAPQAPIIGEWRGLSQEDAYESVRTLIEEGTRFDAILSIDAASTLGAIDALEEAGMERDDVFIVCALGNDRVLSYLESGYYVRGALVRNVEGGARLMLYAALKSLAGTTLPTTLIYQPGEMLAREGSGHAITIANSFRPPR
ncbi:MAG: protein kinase [Anaerolinea sp.]|nr:protein kinase [Anaerolinea sp.]